MILSFNLSWIFSYWLEWGVVLSLVPVAGILIEPRQITKNIAIS